MIGKLTMSFMLAVNNFLIWSTIFLMDSFIKMPTSVELRKFSAEKKENDGRCWRFYAVTKKIKLNGVNWVSIAVTDIIVSY